MTVTALCALLEAKAVVRWQDRGAAVSKRPPEGRYGDERSAGPTSARIGAARRDGTLEEAHRLARAVDRACRVVPWRSSCLVRALALKRLLRRRGFAGADLRVGVRRDRDGLSAHAWVECDGEIVGDSRERIAEYESLPGLEVFPE